MSRRPKGRYKARELCCRVPLLILVPRDSHVLTSKREAVTDRSHAPIFEDEETPRLEATIVAARFAFGKEGAAKY